MFKFQENKVKEFISVNKRKIYTLVFLISIFVYYKAYWFVYSTIISQFSLPIGTLSIIDLFYVSFLLSQCRVQNC